MPQPTLCMIFEATGPYNAIGRVAMQSVQVALDAGWRVTVVAKRLDEELQKRVEWLPLTVPARLFYVQWTTARHYIRKALGNRTFDVVHAHQPQVADLADVFQCHYLTRAAHERNSLTGCNSLRSTFVRFQEQGVLYAEDRCYRTWNANTKMLYDSDLTRDDFHRIYGPLPDEAVFLYSFPALAFPTDEERRVARARWTGVESTKIVLGYLGGLHERKGYRRLIKSLEAHSDVLFLMGGQHTDGFECPSLKGRFKAVGPVSDIKSFYHACDVFIIPSHYEPFGLVAFEAAAHGVPVIATAEVGANPHLRHYGAGASWCPDDPLSDLVCSLATKRKQCNDGARAMARDLGPDQYAMRLLAIYDEAAARKSKLNRKR